MAPSVLRNKGKGRSTGTAAELAAAGALDTDSDFASASLSALDAGLRCAICSELYTAPVILNHCGHSFDSRCLAEHFVVKRDCPTCHREAFHDHMVRNQALAELVESWRAARSDLLDLQARGRTPANDGKRKAASSGSSSPAPTVKREARPNDSSDIEILEETPVARKPPKRPRTRRPDPDKDAPPPPPAAATADPTDPNVVVECPLCGRSLKNSMVSGHLDRCTGDPSTSANPVAGSSQAWSKLMSTSMSTAGGAGILAAAGKDGAADMDPSKKLPLGSYQHKKAAQLVKMLKDYGLPSDSPNGLSADAKVAHLQRRHRQFVILWNANADLDPEHPARKSAKQLRSELKRWEDDQDRTEGKGQVVQDHAVKYAEQYRELIAQARASHEKAKKAKQDAAAARARASLPRGVDAPTADETAQAATAAAAEEEEDDKAPRVAPNERKKSVRVVSPPRSSPPAAAAAAATQDEVIEPGGIARPLDSDDSTTTDSSPLLPSSPLLTSMEDIGDGSLDDSGAVTSSRKRTRTPSPFDPAGPRPSQRNREEERMFAELHGDLEPAITEEAGI
ncbi:hypothetical protein JCM3774_006833 [Rhodotorula dairenensis]